MTAAGDLGRCDYCGKAIRWVATRKGKKMPLDPNPAPDGNVVLELEGIDRTPCARVLTKGEVAAGPTYLSHFATCAKARHYAPDRLRQARDRVFKAAELPPEPRRRPCSAERCTELVERNHLLCRGHWRLVPADIQRAILVHSQRRQVWDEPEPGEVRPNLACRQAAEAAVAHLRASA